MGEHGNEKSRLLRCALRRKSDRPGNGQYLAAGNPKRVSRSRQSSRRDREDRDWPRPMRRWRVWRAFGIDLNAITEKLQQDGVAAFAASFDQLMAASRKKAPIDARRGAGSTGASPRHLPKAGRSAAWHNGKRLNSRAGYGKKIYTLWSKEPQPELTDRLGWLELPETMAKEVGALARLRRQSQSGRHQTCRAARHGRFELGAGSFSTDLWQCARVIPNCTCSTAPIRRR